MNANSLETMRSMRGDEIQQLQTAPLALLKQRYEELFGDLPRVMRRDSLLRRLAWRLQVLAGGDLSERARRRAAEIAKDAELRLLAPRDFLAGVWVEQHRAGTGACRKGCDRRIPPAGTVLTRRYNNQLISVTVLAEGFECEGRRYPSLSAIATAKTGTRWNGIVFFGLHRTQGARHGKR